MFHQRCIKEAKLPSALDIAENIEASKPMGAKRYLHERAENANGEIEVQASIKELDESAYQLTVQSGINRFIRGVRGELGMRIHGRSHGYTINHLKGF